MERVLARSVGYCSAYLLLTGKATWQEILIGCLAALLTAWFDACLMARAPEHATVDVSGLRSLVRAFTRAWVDTIRVSGRAFLPIGGAWVKSDPGHAGDPAIRTLEVSLAPNTILARTAATGSTGSVHRLIASGGEASE